MCVKTEQLYYVKPNLFECQATVCDVKKDNNCTQILLDKTIFFPEGGGQPCDLGTIDGIAIKCVFEHDGEIWHTFCSIQDKIKAGEVVNLKVDSVRRKDNSQQHSGEHVLSGLAHSMFGAVNEGFHMSDEYSTIDLDKELDSCQLKELEFNANRIVFDETPITSETVDLETLSSLKLRKRAKGLEEKSEDFRIVYIGEVDSCTCCGTHCQNTAQIGVIKILSAQKHKTGVRIFFACGIRAVNDYIKKYEYVETLARRFSTNGDEVVSCVSKQGDELAQLKRLYKNSTARLMSHVSRDLLESAPCVRGIKVVVCVDSENAIDTAVLAQKLAESGEKMLAVLLSVNENQLSYVLACSNGVSPAMNELAQTINALFGAKGGGKPTYCQGKAIFKSQSQLTDSTEQLKAYLAQVTGI